MSGELFMAKLTYQDLILPNYVNSSEAVVFTAEVTKGNNSKLESVSLSIPDVIFATEIAGANNLIISDTGKGKSQLLSDIAWSHFGGDIEGGNANIVDGRSAFDIDELFIRTKVDTKSGAYDSDAARQLKLERVRRAFFGIDEINRAPTPVQNDFFDLADGKHTFRGQRALLGQPIEGKNDTYSVFFATANFNKVNSAFQGTFSLDRALLNRAHVTIDLDHKAFRPTYEDKLLIQERKDNPRVDIAKPKDITSLLMEAHTEVALRARQYDPHMQAMLLLFSEGLDFCNADKKTNDKTLFPSLCGECSYAGKEYCSLAKASSDRTTTAIKLLAHSFAKIVELKHGENYKIDPVQAILQAYRFTTYHGDLNEIVTQDEYQGRPQLMMDTVIQKYESLSKTIQSIVLCAEAGGSPVLVRYALKPKNGSSTDYAVPKSKQLIDALKAGKISYTEEDLESVVKEKGIGVDWLNAYTNWVRRNKSS